MNSIGFKLKYKKEQPVTAEKLVEQVKDKTIKRMYCGFCRSVTKHEGLKCKRCE